MQELTRMLPGIDWENVIIALLHSLWQGAVLAAIVWGLLQVISIRHSRLRYGIALAGCFGVLLAAMTTFHLRGDAQRQVVTLETRPASISPVTPLQAEPSAEAAGKIAPASAAPSAPLTDPWAWAAALWIAGSAAMLLRAFSLLLGAERLSRHCEAIDDPQLLKMLSQLKRSLGIRRPVRLAAGAAVVVPAVMGAVIPVVLLPLAALSQMSPEQIRMILAHELAHVRRHDYLVNLLQMVVESLLFFNPAVWWLSRQVRREREACCDALAIAATGTGVDYVRSLAELMAQFIGDQPGLRLTPALKGDAPIKGDGDLLDRAKRVLLPDYRPQLRLPWYSLMAISGLAIVLLTGMWHGSRIAALAAEDWMTPAQRVQTMARLQDEIGDHPESASQQPGQFHLTGSIRTEDGQPLPKGTNVTAESSSSHSSAFYSFPVDHQGHFSMKLDSGTVQFWATAPGYAPSVSESFQASAGGKVQPMQLILSRGFDTILQLSAGDGKSVPGAKVSIGYLRDSDRYNPIDVRDFTSDARGIITLHHAADLPAQVKVDLPGYEYDLIPARLKPLEQTTVVLTAAKPTAGVVTDATTHRPISNATVSLVRRQGFDDRTWMPHSSYNQPPIAARTDAQGHFVLDDLRQDSNYAIWITAPDHGAQFLRGIKAGETAIDCPLGPPLVVSVEIHARADQMPTKVSVDNPAVFENESNDEGFFIPVRVKDSVGIAALINPLPGTVTFGAGGKSVRVQTGSITGPVVLDLQKTIAQSMREVVFKLDWPKDSPAPQAKLRVDYIKPENPNSYTPDELEIKNGEAHLTVPVPTKVGYSQGTITGYWIDDRHEIHVPSGKGPFVVNVHADPAGAIDGVVKDENGLPFKDYFYVELLTEKQSPDVSANRPSSLQPFNGPSQSGHYLMSPLPLGGTYRLVAAAGPRFTVSDPITVTTQQPIQAVDMRFPAGVRVAGKVGGPDGRAAIGIRIQLIARANDATFTADTSTDRDGGFAFEHVNPDGIDYKLNVRPGMDTQGMERDHIAVDGKPLEITLRPGVWAKGQIVDQDTGEPLAGVNVTLAAMDRSGAAYSGEIDTATDAQGIFEARGLEPIPYTVTVPNTYPADAKIIRDPSGKVTGVQLGKLYNASTELITGGQAGVTIIKRLRSPWN